MASQQLGVLKLEVMGPVGRGLHLQSLSAGSRKWGGPVSTTSGGHHPRVPESRYVMSNVAGQVEIVEMLRLPEACPGPSSVAEVSRVSYSVCL